MKILTGVDLIEIERLRGTVERHGERFLQRVFTAQELSDARQDPASLAARFAAKEAVAKALCTGIGPVGWREIEIRRGPAREPLLLLHGAALQKAQEFGVVSWSISLSHSQSHAIAFVAALTE